MIKQFPEIEAFFLQDVFTDKDLEDLKTEIAINYKDKSLYTKAMSLIDLFLIRFKLSTPEELEEFKTKNTSDKSFKKRIKKKHKIATSKNKKVKHIDKSKKEQTYDEAFELDNFLVNFINKPLNKVAIFLEIPTTRFIFKLKYDEKEKLKQSSLFTNEIWNLNKIWIQKKLEKLKKDSLYRNIKFKNNKNSSVTTKPGVYGKLSKSKSIGKIIYTRM